MHRKITGVLIFSLCISCFYFFSWAIADTINGKPIRGGNWHGFITDYLAGEIVVKIKPEADRAQIKDLFRANDSYIIHDFDETRWGLIGCDVNAEVRIFFTAKEKK